MFKIPDDDDEDDEFWKNFPLEEFENLPVNKGEKRQGSPLQKSQEEYKKLCSRNIENVPVNSGLCSSILLPISNDNLPLQDVTLPHKLLLAGISQKPGYHSENLATSPGTPENHYTKQQRQTPQSDRCPKRKFPGPAGMLPRLVPGQKLTDTVMKLDGRGDAQLQKNENLLSANPVENFFGESSWLKLVSDLGEDSSRILNSFSIKELHLKACKKQLYQGKVLLLFAILETVDLSSIDASVRLRDRTGSIQGTIHRNLVKEYGEHLQPGTVLVLKQVGVLSPKPRTHYLNITANNLVSLYSTLPSGQVGIHWQEEDVTYHQLVTNAERLQKSQTLTSPARLPSHIRTPVQNPLVKNLPTVNRQPLPIQMNPLRNIGTSNNSLSNCQSKVCDKISSFPSQKVVATPNASSTSRHQPLGSNQEGSSFLEKEPIKQHQDVLQNNRSRWTFKSNTSLSKPIPGPSSSSSASFLSVPGPSASNTSALNSSLNFESSCHTFGNKILKDQATVSAGCSRNGVSVSVSAGDKYRLRADNCPNANITDPATTTGDTSNMSDIWQDELTDDILSQLSDDLF